MLSIQAFTLVSFFQAMRDLQLANSLEAQAICLCQEALSQIILSLRGTAASGFLKFVIDTFGNEKDFSTAQPEAALCIEGNTEDEDAGDRSKQLQDLLLTLIPGRSLMSVPSVLPTRLSH